MYAKYVCLNTAVAADIRADLLLLLTGTSLIASLGSGCDKPNSSIIANTITPNWTTHDSAASATSFVIKSLNLDGTTYKYLQVNVTAVAAPVVTMIAWESWNATTHVGTNQSAGNASLVSITAASVTIASPTAIYVLVTDRLAMLANSPLNSNNSGVCFEMSRDSLYLSSTHPVHGVSGGGAQGLGESSASAFVGLCRVKNPAAAGDQVGTSIVRAWGMALNQFPFALSCLQTATIRAADESVLLTALPILIVGSTTGTFCVLGRLLGGILYMPGALPTFNHLDEIVVDGVTCIMFKGPGAGAIVVPKG